MASIVVAERHYHKKGARNKDESEISSEEDSFISMTKRALFAKVAFGVSAFVVCSLYTANLVAFLTEERLQFDFDDLDHFIRDGRVACTIGGLQAQLISRYPFLNLQLADSFENVAKDFEQGRCDAVILDSSFRDELRMCKLASVESLFSLPVAFPVRTCLQPEVSYFTAKLVQQGDYTSIRNRFYVRNCDDAPAANGEAEQLRPVHLSLLFYLMFCLMGVVIAQAIWRHKQAKKTRNNVHKKLPKRVQEMPERAKQTRNGMRKKMSKRKLLSKQRAEGNPTELEEGGAALTLSCVSPGQDAGGCGATNQGADSPLPCPRGRAIGQLLEGVLLQYCATPGTAIRNRLLSASPSGITDAADGEHMRADAELSDMELRAKADAQREVQEALRHGATEAELRAHGGSAKGMRIDLGVMRAVR
eukprot:g88.t1